MKSKFLLPVLLLAVAVGCESDKKPRKTPKAEMTEQWDAARGAVLGTLGTEQYKSGNLDKARTSVDAALKLNPKNASLRVLSGKIALEQGQLDQADKELQLAQFADPNNAEADYLRGVVYQRWQKSDIAYQQYLNAAEKAPTELAYVLAAAEMLVDIGRSDEALDMLKSKLQSFEHNPVILDAMGQLLVGKKQYPQAVSMLRQASILATDDAGIKEHLALALFFNKQYRDASELLGKLVADPRNNKRADLYIALGESYEQIGKLNEAKSAFETATQVGPGMPEAWIGVAKISLVKNDLRRAEMSLRKAITLDASTGEAQILMGYLRLRQNRVTDAMAFFQMASALNQNDTVSLCMVGYSYEKQGKIDQAIECYAKALKIRPTDELATKLMASLDQN